MNRELNMKSENKAPEKDILWEKNFTTVLGSQVKKIKVMLYINKNITELQI